MTVVGHHIYLLEFENKSFMFTAILRITQYETTRICMISFKNSHTELGWPVISPRSVGGAGALETCEVKRERSDVKEP